MVTAPSRRQRLSAWVRSCLTLGLAIFLTSGLVGCNRGPREVRIDVTIGPSGLDRRELYVPANTQVAITLRNRDTAQAAAMTTPSPSGVTPPRSFTFVVVQPGALEAPRPADIVAQGPVIAPGKSVTFRFPAPTSGNYEFFCSAGGAPALPGSNSPTVLRGKFVVQ
jgi:hypothetical protein